VPRAPVPPCLPLDAPTFSRRDGRARDRSTVLRVRRRAKLEREVAVFCTGGNVTVDVARMRQQVAAEVLQGYDSGEEITHELMDRIREQIVQLAAHGGRARPSYEGNQQQQQQRQLQQHDEQRRHQETQEQHRQQQEHDRQKQQGYAAAQQHVSERDGSRDDGAYGSHHGGDRRGKAEDGGGRDRRQPAPSDPRRERSHGACTPVHSQPGARNPWTPSNFRYGARSPRVQREDEVMPLRARGEVDEWAAMVEVQGKLAQQGASEYEMQRRGKQREYMESIQQQVRASGRSSIKRCRV